MQLFSFVVLLLLAFPVSAQKESKVTLPLEEYTRLKDQSETPDITVIESVTVTGDYGKNLRLTVKGATSGKVELVNFMELPKGSVFDCSGNALLKKNHYTLQLLAEGKRFSLDCSLSFPNWNEASFTILEALHVKTKITNGDVILSGDPNRQAITLTRTASVSENERAEVTVVGHHRLTVLPEETRFEYRLQLSNPGRSKKTFSFPLKNNELVQTVTADGEYKDSLSEVIFELNPGINTVSIVGRFKGDEFKVPLPSAQNFLLVENSPMLQLSMSTKARRVSVQDTGMFSQYSTARAYLLSSNEAVNWKTKKLEVFTSTGYSVNRATYTVYVPRKGQGIIEAGFEINNQGTPEIPLKVPGRVTYVEVGGIPQVLLKDPSGALLIQVPTGVQQVLLQYEGEGNDNFIGRFVKSDLVKPETVMSDVSLYARLSPKWDLLMGRGIYETRTDLIFSDLLWGILYAFILIFILNKMTFSKKEIFITGFSSFLVFSLLSGAGALFVILMIFLKLYQERAKLAEYWPKKSWVQVGVVALGVLGGVFIYALVGNLSQDLTQDKIASVNMVNESYERGAIGGAMPAPMMKGMSSAVSESQAFNDLASDGGSSAPAVDYKGLPAKVKIPSEGRVIVFSQGMIDQGSVPQLKLILVDQGLVAFLLFLGLLGLGLFLYKHHKKILEAVRT